MGRHRYKVNGAAQRPVDGTALYLNCARVYNDAYERLRSNPTKALTAAEAIALARTLNEACFDMLELIAKAPALDVEPVTRCGACRYYDAASYTCDHPEGLDTQVAETDYCPQGKRRERLC